MLELHIESATSLLALSISLSILSTVTVVGRLLARRISAASFWWDDLLAIVSLLNSYAVHVITPVGVLNGMGRHIEDLPVDKRSMFLHVLYAGQVYYPFSVFTIKLAILLFYFRLFGTRQSFRNIIYATGALVTGWFLGDTFSAIFRCSPISAAFVFHWVYQKEHCINTNAWLVSMSVFNVLLDVWILLLPLSFVWTLQLSSSRKVGLSGIFMLGVLTIGASIARAVSVFSIDVSDITWSTGKVTFWSMVEVSVGVICACLPTLPPIFRALDRKRREVVASFSGYASKSRDLSYSGSSAKQGGTTPKTNTKMTAPQLTLDQEFDYKGFGDDITFKEVGLDQALP